MPVWLLAIDRIVATWSWSVGSIGLFWPQATAGSFAAAT